MLVDFDSAKDAANWSRHGVSLVFGVRVFDDAEHVIIASFRPIDGKDRYKAIGMIDGKLWTAVHIRRGAIVRLISVRRSNANEQRDYDRP